MKQPVIAMKLHPGKIKLDGENFKLRLPEGCTGMLFCFQSKKAAREYWGKDVDLLRIEVKETENRALS